MHNYLWIVINEKNTLTKEIKIKDLYKKIKRIKFIFRIYTKILRIKRNYLLSQ